MNAYRAYDAIEERKWAEQSLTEEKQKWIDDRAQEIIDALPKEPSGLFRFSVPMEKSPYEGLRSDAAGEPKRQYLLQMHAQMMCTGRKWCDFVSFDDRLPPDLAYFKKRIHFDEALANEIQSEVKKFLEELEKEISSIKNHDHAA